MIRTLLIGYHGIGRRWISKIGAEARCESVGVVDISDAMRAEATEATGLPAFASVDEAAKATQADAVVIATPSPAHADNVAEALDAGLHILVEKPFTTDLTRARQLAESAETAGLQLLVSQNYRFRAISQTARRLIRDGKVGSVHSVQIHGFNLADEGGKNYRCRMHNPHLWEMAVHQFDLLRFLFDTEIRSVTCQLFNPSWSWYKGNAATQAWLELDNGVRVNYLGTYVTRGPESHWDNAWRFEGSQGALLWWEQAGMPLRYAAGPASTPEIVPLDDCVPEDLAATLALLCNAIGEGEATACTARDNLRTLAICAACEKSAAEQRTIAVEEIL